MEVLFSFFCSLHRALWISSFTTVALKHMKIIARPRRQALFQRLPVRRAAIGMRVLIAVPQDFPDDLNGLAHLLGKNRQRSTSARSSHCVRNPWESGSCD